MQAKHAHVRLCICTHVAACTHAGAHMHVHVLVHVCAAGRGLRSVSCQGAEGTQPRAHKARGGGGGKEQEGFFLAFSSRRRFPTRRLGKPGPTKAAIMSQASLKATWHKGLSPAGWGSVAERRTQWLALPPLAHNPPRGKA